MLKGEQIADDYTTNMLEKCRKYNGIILVVDTDSGVAGYLTLLINVPTEEIYDGKYEYALVSDIAVLERFKGRGYGKLLLNEATRIARDKNAKWLRLQVLLENQIAKTLYKKADFQELYVDMEKDLSQ
jgi:ribosomal protein S18 acetylase RimI-like enzyme